MAGSVVCQAKDFEQQCAVVVPIPSHTEPVQLWNTTHTAKHVPQCSVTSRVGCAWLPFDSVPGRIFNYHEELHTVLSDNYKLCCPAILPLGFNLNQCQAPTNEISSCDDLLRSGVYRLALAAIVILALMGNVVTFVSRNFIFSCLVISYSQQTTKPDLYTCGKTAPGGTA